MTAVAESSAHRRTSAHRRAWLRTAAAGLAVFLYLVGWSIYATLHTTTRYRPLEPGVAGTAMGAEWRLLSLMETSRLEDSSSGKPQPADAGTTFVIVRLERVPLQPSDFALCSANLLGPGGRIWQASTYELDVQRDAARCDSGDTVVGQSYRFENVYVVPTVFIDQVVGVALTDRSTAKRNLVLRPPPP